MKVALVHDYLNQYGGAERVLEVFCEIWPKAPIFTLVYDAKKTGYAFADKKIITSFLQKIPFARRHHRPFLFLMPSAIEQFDLSKYDIIVSDSASYAKGIITKADTLHICYCHTPIRYAWDDSHKYIEEFGYPFFVKKFIPFFMNYIRLWDELAATRVDKFIANSFFVAKRIKKYYKQEAKIIYPPVKTNIFYISKKPKGYFLAIGRFLPYKRFDLIIRVFNKLGWPLKIIGDGPERKKLKRLARSNIEFVGLISDLELRDYYANCRAFIFPQEEDFGLTACEAMASGRPVIAFRGGGALEIMQEGKTGIFFGKQNVKCLIGALRRFQTMKFDPLLIRECVLKLDKEIFKTKIKNFVEEEWIKFKNRKNEFFQPGQTLSLSFKEATLRNKSNHDCNL